MENYREKMNLTELCCALNQVIFVLQLAGRSVSDATYLEIVWAVNKVSLRCPHKAVEQDITNERGLTWNLKFK